jgi:hypothetical protein
VRKLPALPRGLERRRGVVVAVVAVVLGRGCASAGSASARAGEERLARAGAAATPAIGAGCAVRPASNEVAALEKDAADDRA